MHFSLNITTVDPRRTWFAYAVSDPLIMHTTLALSGTEWLSTKSGISHEVQEEVMRQKVQAIKTTRTYLHRQEANDATIAGIATLANIAVRNIARAHSRLIRD
jgi:hypothetical protein